MTQLARLLLAAARRTPAQAHGLLAPALCALAAQSHHAQAVAHQIPAGWRGADARPISTSGFAASGLTGALEKEMKHEKAEYEKPDIIARGPPAPFSLEDTPGDTTISLTREFKGEQVRLDVSVNLQDGAAMDDFEDEGEDGEDGDDWESNQVNFNVTVTKGEESLVFECTSDGTYVDIRHVSLEPKDGVPSETTYTGPVFPELDDDLQQQFRSFLEERGINEDMGEYVRFLLYDKEQVEYVRWLEGVKKFVSK